MKKQVVILAAFCFIICAGSLFVGPYRINPFSMDDVTQRILISIRLPRLIVAMLMGTALGASGAVLQGILRNPLADPYILGVSGGAALIATAGLLFGTLSIGLFTLPVLAFIGAISAGIALGVLGYSKGGIRPERLLLAGVGLGFLFSALLMLIISLSTDAGIRRATLWIFGDLSMAEWDVIPFGALFISIGLILCLWRAKALNTLILGDEIAHSLGFSASQERFILFVSAGLMTAASVSLGGTVGFIGLLVPHMVRFFAGSDCRIVLPLSALAGGALLCAADTIGRTLVSPAELPSGIVTALIGAPYFLYLLRKKESLGV